MKNKLVLYGLHGAGWLAFLILPYLFALPGSVNLEQVFQNRHDVQMLLTSLLLILFSYLNHLFLVPAFYLPKRYVRYFTLVSLCFLLIASVPFWTEPLVQQMPLPRPPPFRELPVSAMNHTMSPATGEYPRLAPKYAQPPPLSSDLNQILLLFVVSVLVSISVQVSSRLQEAEVGKLQAELGQLKAQIHPHFLFNTLNSIYALALRKDDRTADTVVKLSEFMRYMIRDAGNDRVPLEKETAYIRNYLDLQYARLRDSVKVSYTLTGSTAGWQIAPLILFTFIENGFKHGVNPDEESEIRIELNVLNKDLRLYVFNRKVTVRNPDSDGGLGLENARARLRLLYPDQHRLTIRDNPTGYAIELTIMNV